MTPYNFAADIFTQRNFVADFLQGRCDFRPFGGLMGDVWWSSFARWKARRELPISVNWIFSLGRTAEALRAIIGSKSAISDFASTEPVDPKFQVEGVPTPTILFLRKLDEMIFCIV